MSSICNIGSAGSPPRMWGIRERRVGHTRSHRFTPTHVGNTQGWRWFLTCSSVHPHACGEYFRALGTSTLTGGSPPRMWGIPHVQGDRREAGRFTPTHVGNTIKNPKSCRTSPVHPHACGEYRIVRFTFSLNTGSPPRMWGIRRRRARKRTHPRFTPTHVGNTVWTPSRPTTPPVHPHACGEYLQLACLVTPLIGSPPRMWGIPADLHENHRSGRFTPTHVGNTLSCFGHGMTGSVHPHACGEYKPGVAGEDGAAGSPPRMWGIRHYRAVRHIPPGFTPTHVGNTSRTGSGNGISSVHPHACGEYADGDRDDPQHAGSPPRMWGIHVQLLHAHVRQRFTPTHVGNTISCRLG